MSTSNGDWVVQPGTDVYGSDNQKVGSVDDIQDGYLIVHKGFFFPKDHYIPFSAITSHTDDRIDLNVTADEATNQDWDTVPTGAMASTTTGYDTTGVDMATGTTVATGTTDDYERDLTTEKAPFEHHLAGSMPHIDDANEIRVAVVEEELSATRRGVERGAVRVETNVTEREQTLEVPVTEERVHVERRTVDRPADAADISAQGGVIDVPVYGEEVDMQKQARVVEEVEISKDAVQETRQVSGTVRREDVEVVDGTTTTGTTSTDPRRRGA